MASVAIRGVEKRFGEVAVLRGIDLDIADGEFVVLVGASGCGKSTLLRMIAGLETVSAGDILIGGDRVNDLEPRERDIAMVFQSYALYPHLDVRGNLGFSLALKRTAPDEARARVEQTAGVLELCLEGVNEIVATKYSLVTREMLDLIVNYRGGSAEVQKSWTNIMIEVI